MEQFAPPQEAVSAHIPEIPQEIEASYFRVKAADDDNPSRLQQWLEDLKGRVRPALRRLAYCGIGAALTACSNFSVELPREFNPEPPLPTAVPQKVEDVRAEQTTIPPETEAQIELQDGIKAQTLGGEIVSYTTFDGTTYEVAPGALQQARQLAVETGQPQIFAVFDAVVPPRTSIETTKSANATEFKSPLYETLSEDELKARGVRIIQGDITKLSLGHRAFEPNGSLELLTKDSNKGVVIVLLDSAYIDLAALNDHKYEPIRQAIEVAKEKATGGQVLFEYLKRQKVTYNGDNDAFITEKAEQLWYSSLSAEEKHRYYVSRIGMLEGLFEPTEILLPDDPNRAYSTLILSVGKSQEQKLFAGYITPDGQIHHVAKNNHEGHRLYDRTPQITDSFQDPAVLDQFTRADYNPDFIKSYLLEHGYLKGGVPLDHEVMHLTRFLQGDIIHMVDEGLTDKGAIALQRYKYDNYKATNDPSFYYYQFEVIMPDGSKRYIYGRQEKKEKKRKRPKKIKK